MKEYIYVLIGTATILLGMLLILAGLIGLILFAISDIPVWESILAWIAVFFYSSFILGTILYVGD